MSVSEHLSRRTVATVMCGCLAGVETLDGGAAVRITARFKAGPLGIVYDDVELVLSASSHTCAFRAAASTVVFPFSSSGQARERNRARLLRVRKRLFEKSGWSCACPPELNPFAGFKCSLTCDV